MFELPKELRRVHPMDEWYRTFESVEDAVKFICNRPDTYSQFACLARYEIWEEFINNEHMFRCINYEPLLREYYDFYYLSPFQCLFRIRDLIERGYSATELMKLVYQMEKDSKCEFERRTYDDLFRYLGIMRIRQNIIDALKIHVPHMFYGGDPFISRGNLKRKI